MPAQAFRPIATAWRVLVRRAVKLRWSRWLAILIVVAAITAGFATYAALTEIPPFGQAKAGTVSLLLTIDLGLLMGLLILTVRRIVRIWMGRRRGLAGARLHVRLVLAFSALAAAPAVFMAVFSAVFFYVGVQSWFSDRVRTAINDSVEVAKAYLDEHQQNIATAALSIATDLNHEAPRLLLDRDVFDWYLSWQTYVRALSDMLVFEARGDRLLGRSSFSFALEIVKEGIRPDQIERARGGEVVILNGAGDDRVNALVRLELDDTYLLVGRLIEPKVIAHMQVVEGAVRQYSELERERGSLQIKITLVFLLVAMLLLMAAVWAGLNFATRLVRPISTLIGAAERVRAGDLTVRVPEPEAEDELGLLARAFNRMTTEIENQRHDLLEANRLMDERRRFTETVLFGVSAGVIGLDLDGRINLPNVAAARFLGVDDPERMIGRPLADFAPDIAELLIKAPKHAGRTVQDQIQLRRHGQAPLTLLVRITAEGAGASLRGHVLTFDDITELVSAQRKAAWADVARRIAHEIKNPLTPIQLSAERLRRKYLKLIDGDTEVFTMCTDTIVRQVDDIRRMVDEFSAFARMPQPVMKTVDLRDLIRQAVFLQATAHSGKVRFDMALPDGALPVVCDGRQMSQALTNLLQNAVDAIDGRSPAADGGELPLGEVRVRVETGPEATRLIVEDNGKGLPTEERHRLTEPYVTTRVKGTGLGLAIVRKIMEDHGGEIVLADRDGGGARVTLVIPIIEAPDTERGIEPATSEGQAGRG